MIQHIKEFLKVIRTKSVGMTFIRKFGRSPIPGKTVIVLMTMIAVPDAEAERITSELHAPTVGSCEYCKDVILLAISTGEGKDISLARDPVRDIGSRGQGFDDIARQPIWRFG